MSKKTSNQNDGPQTIQIRASTHKKLKDFCDKNGYKIGYFAEFAILKHIAEQEGK